MIYFKEIEGQGFSSIIRPMVFKLRNKGLTVIQAKNGFGKTTLFALLYWVLYNKHLKPGATVETWERFRPKDYLGTKGRVMFKKKGVQYDVIRCKDYKGKDYGKNSLTLLINGVDFASMKLDHKSNRDKPDVQAKIIEVLGLTSALFKNSVIFGQKLKRIIDETNPDKKQIFEEAFEASYINRALDQAKKQLAEKQRQKSTLNGEIELVQEKLDNRKATRDTGIEFEKNKAEQLESIDKELSKLDLKAPNIDMNLSHCEDFMFDCKEQIKNLRVKLNEVEEKDRRIFKKDLELKGLEVAWQNTDVQLNNIRNDRKKVVAICNSCGQKISKEAQAKQRQELEASYTKLKSLRATQYAQWEEGFEKLQGLKKSLASKTKYIKAISKLELELEELANTERQLYEDQKQFELNKSKEASLNKQKKDILSQKLAIDIPKLKKEISGLIKKLRPLKVHAKTLKKEVDDLIWVIENPLSNKGLKAYIFNSMLKYVNDSLLQYNEYLGFRIEFGIDMQSSRKDFYTVIWRGAQLCKYEDLSGGQQQLVNVALALAIHDVLNHNNDKASNILVMDEVFEGLDEENTDIVGELIKAKAKDKGLYLITHNSSFASFGEKALTVLYEAGNTTYI